jgi:hypothetical protein
MWKCENDMGELENLKMIGEAILIFKLSHFQIC